MRALLMWVVLVATAGQASAQEIPDIDPMKQCRKQTDAVGGGEWLMKACLEQEQAAYDQLKAAWPTLDARTRRQCIGQARAVSLGYWLIQACVEQERSAKEAVQQFKFRK